MNLRNKIAIITGASDGLAKQVAFQLAKEGVKLALIARREKELSEVTNESGKLGSPKAAAYPFDLRDSTKMKEVVGQIVKDFGSVNILLNIAGLWQKLGYLEETPEEVIDEVIDVNLKALIKLTRLVIPHLKEQKEAAIINVSSRSGVTAQPGQAVYTASKWGVTGFSEVLKADLKESGIRVGTIHQGGVDTEMFRKTGEHFDQGKFIPPEELAKIIVFMLSRPERIWLHDARVEY